MGKVYSMTIKYLDSKRISALAYELNAYTTESAYDTTGVTYGAESPLSTSQIRRGIKILSGSSAIGKIIRKVSTKFRGTSSPTGSLYFKVYRSGSAISTSEALDVSTLTTSFVLKELTLDTKVTLEADDRVVAEYTDATGSMTVHFLYNNNPSTIASGFEHTSWNGSAWSDINYDLMFAFDSTPASYTNPTGDVKPTNVQDNSILVETDTARRYWFDAESDNTIAFEDDFSSDTWTGCKINACDNGAPTTVTISGGDLSAVNVNVASDDRMRKALGLTLSNTAWIYQFEANVSSTGTHSTLIGLVTSGGNMNNTSILCDYNGSNKIIMREYNSGLTEMGSGISISTGTQYYVTVIRTSLTGLTLEVRTGSHTGTLVGSESGTITGATGLTYVQSGAYGRGSGTASYDIDNIKIYNGVTSTTTPATWTRQPPSFTASFWAAGGTAGPWTPVNYHDEFNGSTWSSATALGTSVEMVIGCGTQSAGLIMGGDTSGTVNPTTTVQEWNGSAWSTSTGGTLNVARGANAGGGINTDAWVACGNDGSTESTTSSFWDDSSWTSGAALSTARRNVAGGGSTTDCWVTGGYTGSATVASTEQYNGTSWSAGGNISAATDGLQGGSGDTYNAIFTGGTAPSASNRSNIYNGTAWSLGGTLSNTHRYGITSGTPQDAISGMGYISSWTPTWAELYNGTTWSTTGSVGSGRATGGSGN